MRYDRHVVAGLVVLAGRGVLSGLQTRSDPRAGVDRGEWADHRSRADEQWKLALPLAARRATEHHVLADDALLSQVHVRRDDRGLMYAWGLGVGGRGIGVTRCNLRPSR